MSNYYIGQAQILLRQKGVYEGVIDGIFGKESFKAVQKLVNSTSNINKEKSVNNLVKQTVDEPIWIKEARKHIGLKEIKGSKHNPTILKWIKNLGGWFTTDEIPWCGTFIAQCLAQAGRGVPKHWYRALAYKNYGTQLSKPAFGSIGVMGRKGGGHVTFIVGQTADGKYLVGLGGNQSNSVNLMKFPRSRFNAWVWPSYKTGVKSSPYPSRYKLPLYDNNMQLSTRES